MGVMLLGPVSAAFGQAGPPVPSPSEWAREAKAGNAVRLLENVVVVRSIDPRGNPHFLPMSEQGIESFRNFHFIRPVDAHLTLLLNDPPEPARDQAAAISNLFAMLEADAALVGHPKTGSWTLTTRDDLRSASLTFGRSERGRNPPPATIVAMLERLVGYHGVVLAVRGDLLLVEAKSHDFDAYRQGVIVGGSAQQMIVDRSQAKAVAIVEKIAVENQYAVFRTVLARPSEGDDELAIMPGSKVLFGEKSR